MGRRKVVLVRNHYYHVFTRSIAEYQVFRTDREYKRMLDALRFYRNHQPGVRFSWWLNQALKKYTTMQTNTPRIQVLAYCLMPTHIHLFLQQIEKNGISEFMRLVLNSYAKYFNIRTKRRGPLWESKFKNVRVETDEQALHLTRYIHLNPVSAGLVPNAEDWQFSSYGEYLGNHKAEAFCEFEHVLNIVPEQYRKFVDDRKDEQRHLQILKANLLD